jgi:hypothetical protein
MSFGPVGIAQWTLSGSALYSTRPGDRHACRASRVVPVMGTTE